MIKQKYQNLQSLWTLPRLCCQDEESGSRQCKSKLGWESRKVFFDKKFDDVIWLIVELTLIPVLLS
jgi:hypothetical protein